MKKVPEYVIKLIKSPINSDIILGMEYAVPYFDDHEKFFYFMSEHISWDMPKMEEGYTWSWREFYDLNKKE